MGQFGSRTCGFLFRDPTCDPTLASAWCFQMPRIKSTIWPMRRKKEEEEELVDKNRVRELRIIRFYLHSDHI